MHQAAPAGWRSEIYVGIEAGDRVARELCEANGAMVVEVKKTGHGPKRNAAIQRSSGCLLLIADDDDIPSPQRLRLAIEAYQRGYKVTSTREFRYLHLPSGLVVRWHGRKNTNGGVPPAVVGAARNIARTIMTAVRGYSDLPRQIDSELQHRVIHQHRIHDADLSSIGLDGVSSLWTETVNVQHGGNIWSDRQELARGVTVQRGAYRLVGEGHWSELEDFPRSVATALGL